MTKKPTSIVEVGPLYRIVLEVHVDGYEVRRERDGDFVIGEENDDLYLFPLGSAVRQREIGIGEEDVFAELLLMEPTEKGAIDFTSKFGRIIGWGGDPSPLLGDPLRELFELRQTFHDILQAGWSARELAARLATTGVGNRRRPKSFSIGPADLTLTVDKLGQPQLAWYVSSLRSFLWLEFVTDLQGTPKIAICTTCGKFFRRRSTYRGPLPIHCSSACKQRQYRRRQKTE